MNVLALYHYINKESKGKMVSYMDSEDVRVINELRSLGHKVDKKEFSHNVSFKGYDVVFNLCDGFEDDMEFPELPILKELEKQKVRFTGNSYNTIKLCNSKINLKKKLQKHKVPTAPFQVMHTGKEKRKLDFPLIVKPAKTDAAVGIFFSSVVNSERDFRKQVKKAMKYGSVIVEPYLNGREFCVPVLGKKKIKALSPAEMRFGKIYKDLPKILSYETKWAKGTAICKKVRPVIRHKPNRNFSKSMKKKIMSLAEKAYKVAGCTGYATVDIRYDAHGAPFVLEVNPNPWIGKSSETAKSAKIMGISYAKLLEKIIKIAKN